MGDAKKKICELGGGGLLLPLSDGEQSWDDGFRGFLYAVAMIYSFLGVSIIADMFMGAIEVITSRRHKVKLEASQQTITPKVWNEAVANLSLMALGSSAPEIFLSVIDLFRNKMYAGDLGPSVIVGSAAFNLFVIVAVCIVVIPAGEMRQIEQLPVFYVTAVFSLFAYLWIVVILVFITPDVVDVWEAIATFLFLPLLIWISYKVDRGDIELPGLRGPRDDADVAEGVGTAVECGRARKSARRSARGSARTSATQSTGLGHHRHAHAEAKHQLVASIKRGSVIHTPMCRQSHGSTRGSVSRNSVGVGRGSTGPGSTEPTDGLTGCVLGARGSACSMKDTGEFGSQVQFLVDNQCMSKDLASKSVTLVRAGDLSFDVKIAYSVHLRSEAQLPSPQVGAAVQLPQLAEGEVTTVSTTKKKKKRSLPVPSTPEVAEGSILFESGEPEKAIQVERPLRADGGDPCEDFVVLLRQIESPSRAPGLTQASWGPIVCTQVKVLPARSPGKLDFTVQSMQVPGKSESQTLEVVVVRRDGCSGRVTCKFHTERFTAVPDYHYVDTEGELLFEEGVTERRLTIEVLPKDIHRSQHEFLVILDEAEGGAEFDLETDGGEEAAILTVTLLPLAPPNGRVSVWRRLDHIFNIDAIRLGNTDWAEQFMGALFVNGSLEEQRNAEASDWVFHLLCLPWKLLFAFVPAPSYFGGWLCFYASLGYIALLTGFIADLAELFGCVLDVPDMVTAITFVALGTSMPDLFASRSAATEDPTADASIVNVTGSNSVNVFLGLGLPWTIAAISWVTGGRSSEWEARYPAAAKDYPKGAVFVVEAKNLGFSVLVFSVCCILGIALIVMRRRCTGAELGGPQAPKLSTAIAFVFLWLAYIVLACWRAVRGASASTTEEVGVIVAVSSAVMIIAAFPAVIMLRHTPDEPIMSTESSSKDKE